jgi:RNA chaperone Hfq
MQRNPYPPRKMDHADHGFSETESSYLKSLIDSRSKVTVFMKNGERFNGRIRYYDRDCFSIGLSTEKRKIFLRKEHVSYISEE